MAKYNHRFIAMDTETGGFSSKDNLATIDVALTEVAVVAIENESLEIVEKDSWLIKPYIDLNPDLIYTSGAEKVSGISRSMCEKEGLGIELVYKSLVAFFKKHKIGRLKPIIIFQNKSFDIPFMENLFAIFSDDFHKYIDRVEDTLEWGRFKWIEKPSFSLGALADLCGLDLVQAHRALPDTEMAAKIWIYFMKNLRGEGQATQEESVEKFREGFKF